MGNRKCVLSVKHFIIFLIVVVCSCKTVKDNQVSEYPYHSVAENIEANIKNEDIESLSKGYMRALKEY
ncbi:MAG: hypothetical protein II258_04370, partial [Spirochaetales bacterium]|nr:hypothetical protein [Spirochaetales bacterium]